MRMTGWVLIPLTVLAANIAFGQDDEKAKLKKEILQKVEELIKAEEARILKDIEALLDRELGAQKPADQPTGKPDEKPADKPADKPSDEAKKKRGYLGVRPGDLSDEEREELKLKPEDGGIKIGEVLPDTAADGKLEADDIILKVDGKVISDVQGLISAIQASGAGQEIVLNILREGKPKEVKIKLGVHPDDQE